MIFSSTRPKPATPPPDTEEWHGSQDFAQILRCRPASIIMMRVFLVYGDIGRLAHPAPSLFRLPQVGLMRPEAVQIGLTAPPPPRDGGDTPWDSWL